MANKSRGEYAYTVLDIANDAGEEVVKSLEDIDGVLKVRVIK
jgi:D-3-phosphoglycerate dehydrogenase